MGHMFKNLFFSNQHNPPHQKDSWEMLFVESNQIKAQTPNGIFQIKSGQAIFHAPGEIHHHFNDYDQNAMIIDIVFIRFIAIIYSTYLHVNFASKTRLIELVN